MIEYFQPRKILEVFKIFGKDWMIHLMTKSNMILDDADLLAEMRNQVQVEISMSTLDDEGYRLFERGTPNPKSRLKIIEELSKRGTMIQQYRAMLFILAYRLPNRLPLNE
jgi:DNA repair photolyase